MTSVSTIVVTFNTGPTVLSSLESLKQTSPELTQQIIVVDNGSTDNTVALIRQGHPDVRIIPLSENLGFGAGNNVGARNATGEFIAFVNPDLTVEKDTLLKLVTYLQKNPSAGIAAPRTLNADRQISITARPAYTVLYVALNYLAIGRLFPSWENGAEYRVSLYASQPQDVHWLQGSCLVMRRELYERLGGFDLGFFLYVEDVDLCTRVHDLGLQVVYDPDTLVTHIGGTSAARHPEIRVRNYHLSPLYYFSKRNKPLQVALLKLVFTVELLAKSLIRRFRNIFQYDSQRARQAEAEVTVLLECWRY